MQHLEVSCAVRPVQWPLGVKWLMKLEFLGRFSKNTQITNLKKIRPVGADLLHADGRTDRQDEADSRFSQFWEST